MYFHDYLKEQLKDPKLADEYMKCQPELSVLRARLSRKISQKELAKRSGITQGEISKIETGVRNPSIKLLQRIAGALDMVLEVSFIPKDEYMKNLMESLENDKA